MTNVGVRGPYSNAVDTICFSHTLHNALGTSSEAGEEVGRLCGPNANEFFKHSNGLMSSAQSNGKLVWRQDMGSSYPFPGDTRWGSHYETKAYVLSSLLPTATAQLQIIGAPNRPNFDSHDPFPITFAKWTSLHYKENGGTLAGNHISYLFHTLVPGNSEFNARRLALIEFESAVAVDVSLSIRYAIYQAEGDGPISFLISSIVDSVQQTFRENFDGMSYPNVQFSISKNVASGFHPTSLAGVYSAEDLRTAWIAYGKELSGRCRRHIDQKVAGCLTMPLYRELIMFDPYFFYSKDDDWNIYDTFEDSLSQYFKMLIEKKLISEADVALLAAEVPALRLLCTSLKADEYGPSNKLSRRSSFIQEFWFRARLPAKSVPTWFKYATKLMLLQPSSATVERVFSILDYLMTDVVAGGRPLVDYIESRVMLKYNSASRQRLAEFLEQYK